MAPDTGDAQDQRKSSTFRLTAEAGRWNGAGLRDLPRGASISVEATADGAVSILLMDETGFRAFPNGGVPLLESSDSTSADFSLIIPAAGDYFLIIDNRAGSEARTAVIRVTAAAPAAMSEEQYGKAANQMLSLIGEALNRVFLLDNLELRMEACGEARSFAETEDIVICTEFAQVLLTSLEDPAVGSPIMMFTIFQRIAERLAGDRVLSEREMDDLAAAVMVLLGYRGHVDTVLSFFAEPEKAESIESSLTGSERYRLTTERARQLSEAVSDPELLVRWRELFLANLQTPILRQLRNAPPAWVSTEELDAAIAERSAE